MYKKVIDIAHALLLLHSSLLRVIAFLYCAFAPPTLSWEQEIVSKSLSTRKKVQQVAKISSGFLHGRKPHTKNKHNKNNVKIVHTIIGFPLNVFTSSLKYLYAWNKRMTTHVKQWYACVWIWRWQENCLPSEHCPLSQTAHTNSYYVQTHNWSSLGSFHQKTELSLPIINKKNLFTYLYSTL